MAGSELKAGSLAGLTPPTCEPHNSFLTSTLCKGPDQTLIHLPQLCQLPTTSQIVHAINPFILWSSMESITSSNPLIHVRAFLHISVRKKKWFKIPDWKAPVQGPRFSGEVQTSLPYRQSVPAIGYCSLADDRHRDPLPSGYSLGGAEVPPYPHLWKKIVYL